MNFKLFIARRISYQSHRPFTRVIIRLSLIAVSLSIAIMLISDAIVIGFQNEIKNKVISFSSHIQISKTRTNIAFDVEPVMYDSQLVNTIKAMPNVNHVQVYATKPGIVTANEEFEGVVMKGIPADFDWEQIKDKIVEGQPFEVSDTMASKSIVISKYLADKLDLNIGDEILMYFLPQPIRIRQFVLTGIYQTNIEEIDQVFVLADIQHTQSLNNWHNSQIAGYEVFIDDFEQLEANTEDIRYLLDVDKDALSIKERYPQIFDWLELLDVNVQIILTLMALVAAINMITALIIMILERTQMIGILKALGATDKQVRGIFLINSARLIGYGMLIGNGAALLLLGLQKYFHIIKLSEETYYLSTVPIEINIGHWLLINAGAFAFTSVAMLLPSYMVVRIRPVKAIRFD